MYAEAKENDADMAKGNLLAYHNKNKDTWKYTLGDNKLELFFHQKEITSLSQNKLLQLPFIHVSFLIRADIAKKTKVPDLAIAEDSPFLLSCLMKANKVICLPDVFYYYRVGHDSISNKALSLPITKSYDYVTHLLLIKDIYFTNGYEKTFDSYLLTCIHRVLEIKKTYNYELNNIGFYTYLLSVFEDVDI